MKTDDESKREGKEVPVCVYAFLFGIAIALWGFAAGDYRFGEGAPPVWLQFVELFAISFGVISVAFYIRQWLDNRRKKS